MVNNSCTPHRASCKISLQGDNLSSNGFSNWRCLLAFEYAYSFFMHKWKKQLAKNVLPKFEKSKPYFVTKTINIELSFCLHIGWILHENSEFFLNQEFSHDIRRSFKEGSESRKSSFRHKPTGHFSKLFFLRPPLV